MLLIFHWILRTIHWFHFLILILFLWYLFLPEWFEIIFILLRTYLIFNLIFLVSCDLLFDYFVTERYFEIMVFLLAKFIELFEFTPGLILASHFYKWSRRVTDGSLSTNLFTLIIILTIYTVQIVSRIINHFISLRLIFKINSVSSSRGLLRIHHAIISRPCTIITLLSYLLIQHVQIHMIINIILYHYKSIWFQWLTWSLRLIWWWILTFKSEIVIVHVFWKSAKLVFLVPSVFLFFFLCGFFVESSFRFWFIVSLFVMGSVFGGGSD